MTFDRLGRGRALAQGFAILSLLGAGACGDDAKTPKLGGSQAALTGRVFSADTNEPLKATIVAPGGTKAQTDSDGDFKVSYPAEKKGAVEASGKQHAPVTKEAPAGDGYMELFAKGFDAEKDIDPARGGEVKTPNGTKVSVPAAKLLHTDDDAAPQKAKLSIAAPDPTKASDLSALPGNFEAKQKAGKTGKLSADSPVYVSASEDGKALKLSGKAKVELPVHTKAKQKAAGATLYHFDETSGLWLEKSQATSANNGDGVPVFQGEIDQLGWWTVGTFTISSRVCVPAPWMRTTSPWRLRARS